MTLVPVIPDTAPFTAEQRAYLNGFLAGLFSRAPAGGGEPAAAPRSPALQPLSILVGSQTGNCERLAKRLAKESGQRGFAPTIHDLLNYSPTELATVSHALIVTSTFGDGEPPDNAKAFWDCLAAETAPGLSKVQFSVCALGDSSYARFCGFGRALDGRLEKLGARRVFPRVDCDVDYEEAFAQWMAGAMAAFASAPSPSLSPADSLPGHAITVFGGATAATERSPAAPAATSGTRSKEHPFPARLKTNRCLSRAGSAKDVRHFEIALAGSGLRYEVGDALGIVPRNDPGLVEEMLQALGLSGDESVPSAAGSSVSLREALTLHYEITRIPKALLEACAAHTHDECLKRAAAPDANGQLTEFLRGREIIDLLLAEPRGRLGAAAFVKLLRKLQPRLYSISSSLKAHPDEVHLTVNAVRYESLGRARRGVCSTFLADRVQLDTPVPVFVHINQAFRLPAPDAPLIMVGPGTGIAPFRAFLEERRTTGASGRNWLFFGDQKVNTDFLYQEEIESYQHDGLLNRLDLAWSRDDAEKVYVQHRLREQAGTLFAWLEEGASFYVCGDASRMAKDVDAALHEVIEQAGGKTPEQASEYVRQLKIQKRYLRDVY